MKMKKTFAFALLLTLCSGSSAFGMMDTFNSAVDQVGRIAGAALSAQKMPLVRHIFHPGTHKTGPEAGTNKGWLGENARYPRALMSLVMVWRAWKSETVRKCASTVTAPVRSLCTGCCKKSKK